ncbi:hypothetical protein PSA7680_01677 [Pseudoruegeria aquimaris]|uniref:Uncharacterized protein n=1 Tax=Pseudoruegeria aquimaris TaxID=393663 RepID=A0A1Y5SBW1_9RHOB|nr:hypothetical protein [Pseudoruegeria aquimaris]SLN35664.1 hypothetical protein PSA7680_01677 [Pseudoruegeria aquimaris]
MAEAQLTKSRIQAGVWEGVLSLEGGADGAPEIEVTHLEKPVEGVSLEPIDGAQGQWHLRIPIPAAALSDGVQTFLIRSRPDDVTLGSFAILTGEPMSEDIRAEMDLLRAELDMLKRAFRRHCVETMG